MNVLMDGLLLAAALFAGGYCWVLSTRVRALQSLDTGLGASIVKLTRQIELARDTLEDSRETAGKAQEDMRALLSRADIANSQLRHATGRAETAETSLTACLNETETRMQVLREMRAEMARAAVPPAPPPAPDPRPAPLAAPAPAPEQSAPEPAAADTGESEAERPSATVTELPKPRRLSPLRNPLRQRIETPVVEERSEDALMEALSAMAGGARS